MNEVDDHWFAKMREVLFQFFVARIIFGCFAKVKEDLFQCWFLDSLLLYKGV